MESTIKKHTRNIDSIINHRHETHRRKVSFPQLRTLWRITGTGTHSLSRHCALRALPPAGERRLTTATAFTARHAAILAGISATEQLMQPELAINICPTSMPISDNNLSTISHINTDVLIQKSLRTLRIL